MRTDKHSETTETDGKLHSHTNLLSRHKWWFIILAVLLSIAVLATVLASRAMQRLDTRIQEVFDGPKWSIPARVYARPLELYAGLNLDQSTLVEELERLGYTQITTGNLQPGQYKADASGVYLYTCLLYTSPSPRDRTRSRMPSSA